jgi:hypothetical protein
MKKQTQTKTSRATMKNKLVLKGERIASLTGEQLRHVVGASFGEACTSGGPGCQTL